MNLRHQYAIIALFSWQTLADKQAGA